MKITVDASKQQFIQLARCNGKSILSKKILDAKYLILRGERRKYD